MRSELTFALDDEQEALERTVKRLVDSPSTHEGLRRVVDNGGGHDAVAWAHLVELGLAGLTVEVSYGGSGLGDVELAVVCEQLGRGLVPTPYFATVALGASALRIAGDEVQRHRFLPSLASGARTATLAFLGGDRFTLEPATSLSVTQVVGGYRLDGRLGFVLDGDTADLIVVRAGDGLFVLDTAILGPAEGLIRTRTPSLDMTRPLARLELRGLVVPADTRLAVTASVAMPSIIHRAQIALAAEQAGGARRCLEMSADYAKVRTQFGRPIGSFQAISHRCADLMVEVETARTAAWYGAFVGSTGSTDLEAVAALAASTCGAAFLKCAGENIQIHGGIGFTWEHDAHLFYKRARASAALFGDAAWHADRYAALLMGGGS